MKNSFSFTLTLIICLVGIVKTSAQSEDEIAITSILRKQQKAWSNNDLEGFMQGYWESDSLTYYSGGKVTQGWKTTLNNYKRGYPSERETGTLNFQIDAISKINKNAYYVMGQYFLTRNAGNASGTFMIIFKKIAGKWKIVADSSC